MVSGDLSPKFVAILNSVWARVAEDQSHESVEELLMVIRSGHLRQPHHFLDQFKKAPVPRIIAEVKLASPSEGDIAPGLDPVGVATDYLDNGAAALSVLTEPSFFKGDKRYVESIREKHPEALILWKDFVLDSYQLLQARVYGADAVLLIVAAIAPEALSDMYKMSIELGLTPLVEVHGSEELEKALGLGARLIGVNNRNLRTEKMEISLETSSQALARRAAGKAFLISESGIKEPDDLIFLRSRGYHGFLIGTEFMHTGAPGAALRKFREQTKWL